MSSVIVTRLQRNTLISLCGRVSEKFHAIPDEQVSYINIDGTYKYLNTREISKVSLIRHRSVSRNASKRRQGNGQVKRFRLLLSLGSPCYGQGCIALQNKKRSLPDRFNESARRFEWKF